MYDANFVKGAPVKSRHRQELVAESVQGDLQVVHCARFQITIAENG